MLLIEVSHSDVFSKLLRNGPLQHVKKNTNNLVLNEI